MKLFWELWNDESGLVLSAETVTLGTVGVLGSIAGLSAMGTAIDGEFKEMASAFRSLDQSYGYLGHRSCSAWTAGSCYTQRDVQESLAEINAEGTNDPKTIQQRVEEQRKSFGQPSVQPEVVPAKPSTEPLPNQLPKQPEPPVNPGA